MRTIPIRDNTASSKSLSAHSSRAHRRFTDEVLSNEMADILRAKSPAARLALALNSWTFIRDLIRRTAAHQHPDWSEAELERHVAQRMSHGAI